MITRLKMTLVWIICLSLPLAGTQAQNPDGSKYIELVYIKSKTLDYTKIEREVWKKYHQSIIQAGKQQGWYIYKLKYPTGDQSAYDYVVVNVYRAWEHLISTPEVSATAIKTAMTGVDESAVKARFEASRIVVWKQLFTLSGQAVEKETKPAKYIIANEMKVLPGKESEYVKHELTYFKPFHTARASEGIMNNWGLYKRAMPYGDKYPFDFITLNGYATWDDIIKQNPPTAWKKVHGDLNFNEIHDRTVAMRQTINVECWELVDYVTN